MVIIMKSVRGGLKILVKGSNIPGSSGSNNPGSGGSLSYSNSETSTHLNKEGSSDSMFGFGANSSDNSNLNSFGSSSSLEIITKFSLSPLPESYSEETKKIIQEAVS